jgi:hypothetical protein
MKTCSLFAIVLFSGALCARAGTIVWTNQNGGQWNVAANWSPNQVPSTNDTATITNSGVYTVSFNENAALAGLILGGVSGTQTVSMVNRILTLNGSAFVATNGILTHTGTSAIHGTNSIRVCGSFRWQGGILGTNTALSISPEGSLVLSSGGSYAKTAYGTITNAGTMIWQPTGNLVVRGCLHIQPSGSFDAQFAGTIGGNGIIINDGLLRASSSGSVNCNVHVINNGTVESAAGTLTLGGGSVLNAGSAFTGPGLTRIDSGTNVLNGDIHSENLSLLYSVTLSGTGSFSGTLIWGGGTISSNAFITVRTNGHLRIESAYKHAKLLVGLLVNQGTITLKPQGDLLLSGVLTNIGLFDFQAQSGGSIGQGGAGELHNYGTVQVTNGPAACRVPINNCGSIRIGAGAMATFEDTLHNPQGSIVLEGGALRCYQPLSLTGGGLLGWGIVTADVTNGASIHPASSNGVLKIVGLYRQLIAGRLEIDVAGSSPGTNLSRLDVTGPAILNGTVALNWMPEFTVSPGNSFEVLSFNIRQKTFCAFDNCYRLGENCRLLPVYNSKSFALSAISAPDPTVVPLSVSVEGETALVSWPVEFSGFGLSSKTNLASPAWNPLPGASNLWLDTPMLKEKYFRLTQ